MKKFSIIFLTSIILFVGCGKDDNTNNPIKNNNTMSGSIEGYRTQAFTPDSVIFQKALTGVGVEEITATQGNTQVYATKIKFVFNNLPAGASTINLFDTTLTSNVDVRFYSSGGGYKDFPKAKGTINVTENSATILRATFSLIAGDTTTQNYFKWTNGKLYVEKPQ